MAGHHLRMKLSGSERYDAELESIRKAAKIQEDERLLYQQEYQSKYRALNKDNLVRYRKEYYRKNKEKLKRESRNRYSKNSDRIKVVSEIYRKANKEVIKKRNVLNKEYHRLYRKQRCKDDHLFALCGLLRSRLYYALRANGYKKSCKTSEALGCSWQEFKQHIESQFQTGMTWENRGRGGWHIDHIIPLASADTEADLKKLFHFTNTQPLWETDNLNKSSRMPCGKIVRKFKNK